ncbi:MAG: GNAT family N-acetyltransferase [Desulfuromonas sp.]|jgi:GNAT superfamily N-acetyltransferase|nr:MAG: GNAT family N-acetyltransferase [Desulfuromonas sp.]
MKNLTIRDAGAEDARLILDFITELAIYEKAEQKVVAGEDEIRTSLFGEGASARALICLQDDKPIGYAVYFFNYSTWLGRNGLYLEDLYITPECRGCGAGKFVLRHLAQIAIVNGCGRFEWSVLDWNEPAIKFYQSIGAEPQDEWVIYRLADDKLLDFANSESKETDG